MCRYLYLSKLVTISGASGAIARLILDQVCIFFLSLATPRTWILLPCPALSLCLQLSYFLFWLFFLSSQFIFAPIFIGVFMSLLVTLEGKPSIVVPKLKQVRWTLLYSFTPCYDMHLLFSWLLIFVSDIYRSGYHQCWQIGNYGYHFSFSIFTSSLRSFRSSKTLLFKSCYTSMLRVLPLPTYYHLFSRSLLLILYPLHGMWFCHLKLTRKLSRNRYY
jgi:hypothetical protein